MDGKRLLVLISLLSVGMMGCSAQNAQVNQVTDSFDKITCRSSAAVETEFIVQWEDDTFSVEKGESPEQFRNEFVPQYVDFIKHVQINQRVYSVTPIRAQETQMDTAVPVMGWGNDSIQASAAWNAGFRGQNIKVAVVDAPVDVSHPQLKTRIAINTGETPNNGIDDDKNGYVDDYYGATFYSSPSTTTEVNDHGTHVSGIIAADPTQGQMSGVAPQAQIIPATFLDNTGNGTLGDAILAMQYAADRGAQIINASWGGTGCDESLGNAFVALSERGILLVVAAGNNGADIDVTPFYPAVYNLPNQITVSASDENDIVPAWSNVGFRNSLLTAPGVDIVSTAFNDRYVTMDGTSMATPFVSGAAAVLWSAKPTATASQIKQAILQGVDVIPGKNSKTYTRGRLNLQKSLAILNSLVP
jgi:subtilisin family serine protease